MNADRMTVEEGWVTVNETPIHYLRAGNGPPMVLIHGLVGSAHNWDLNLKTFAAHRTVYALDLPNMGQSGRSDLLGAGLEAQADWLSAFFQAAGIRRADVAAHSHGGAVALMFSARHTRLVRKLILFAPANPFCSLCRPLLRFYSSGLGRWLARQVPRMPRVVHSIAHRRMYGDPLRTRNEMLDGYTANLNRGSIEHILRIIQEWHRDMDRLLERLGTAALPPSLLVWGDRDRAVGVDSGHKLAAVVGARLLVLAGVGHIPFAEKAELCNGAVCDFLEGAAA